MSVTAVQNQIVTLETEETKNGCAPGQTVCADRDS
jgi:hypothetical protein